MLSHIAGMHHNTLYFWVIEHVLRMRFHYPPAPVAVAEPKDYITTGLLTFSVGVVAGLYLGEIIGMQVIGALPPDHLFGFVA